MGKNKKSKKEKKEKKKEKKKDKTIIQKVVRDVANVLGDDQYFDLLMKGSGWLGSHLWSAAKTAAPWVMGGASLLPILAAEHNPYHPRSKVTPRHMQMSARPRSTVTSKPTLLRQVYLPSKALGDAAEGVGFSSDVKLTSFETSAPLTTPHGTQCNVSSGRAYLMPAPSSATRGELLLSVPLDLGRGLLASSRLNAQAALYNRVKWMGFTLIYVPICPVNTDGAMMFVGGSDPLRTIAAYPAGEARIVAASQYAGNSAMTRTWEPCSLFCPLEDSVMYQNMFSSVEADERFVAPGIVEVLATNDWSGGSPGYFMFEWECILEEPVPSPAQANQLTTSSSNFYSFNNEALLAPAGGPLITPTTLFGVANAGPFSPTNDEEGWSMFNSSTTTEYAPNGSTVKHSIGGLANLGFTLLGSSAAAMTLGCPIGSYIMNLQVACSASTFGGAAFVATPGPGVSSATATSSETYGSGSWNNQVVTFSCAVAGSTLSITWPRPAYTITSAHRVIFAISVARVASQVLRFPPHVVEALVRVRDPFFARRGGNFVVDSEEEEWVGDAAMAPAEGPTVGIDEKRVVSEARGAVEEVRRLMNRAVDEGRPATVIDHPSITSLVGNGTAIFEHADAVSALRLGKPRAQRTGPRLTLNLLTGDVYPEDPLLRDALE